MLSVLGEGWGQGMWVYPHNGLAPETPPVLQPPDTATGPVADSTACTDGQVPLQPLMGHGHLQRRAATNSILHT